MSISYIVSNYHSALSLLCCVTSLLQQDATEEILIADNSTDPQQIQFVENMLSLSYKIRRIDTSKVCPTPTEQVAPCYAAANEVAKEAKGEWLCFPSSDSYYVPGFARIMLDTADELGLEFVYADFLYDPRYNTTHYQVVQAYPRYRMFDKTCFIVKRDRFNGFPLKSNGADDYLLCAGLLEAGVKHGKAPGVLLVHN